MSVNELMLWLTKEEAAALLLYVALGTDAYDGHIPDSEVRDELDRVPPKHLKTLSVKLETIAQQLEAN
jgi:hypothetical protein